MYPGDSSRLQYVFLCPHFLSSSDNPNTEVEVLDIQDLAFDDIEAVTDIDHAVAQFSMAAAWRTTQEKGSAIKW